MNLIDDLRGTIKLFVWAFLSLAFFVYILSLSQLYAGIIIVAIIWLLLVDPVFNIPRIYFVKETGFFLYTKGNQHISFDAMTLMDEKYNKGFSGVNDLHMSGPGPAKLNESSSYVVFDNDGSAIAILPHQRWYGMNQADAKVIFIDTDGKKTRMRIGEFIEHQGQLLHDAKVANKKQAKA